MKTLVLIPSRLSAERLPGKPLLKINGISVISHVVKKANEAEIGEVYVATPDQKIFDLIQNSGGELCSLHLITKQAQTEFMRYLKIILIAIQT